MIDEEEDGYLVCEECGEVNALTSCGLVESDSGDEYSCPDCGHLHDLS